jgi:hypothetical protein
MFNPHRVPSTSILTGKREPICEPCITLINGKMRAEGRPEWTVHKDAYEPIDESEL